MTITRRSAEQPSSSHAGQLVFCLFRRMLRLGGVTGLLVLVVVVVVAVVATGRVVDVAGARIEK